MGTNLQNIEKSLRGIYWADEGKILVQVDQSGAEALIVAYEMPGPNKMRDMFTYKIKPHQYLGLFFPEHWEQDFPFVRSLVNIDIPTLAKMETWRALQEAISLSDENPPATRYYFHYKMTCHSGNYGIKAPTFRMNVLEKSGGKVVLTLPQATKYLLGYNTMIPLRQWWHRVEQQLYSPSHTIYNLFGYPREFTGLIQESMFKEAYAFSPQSTVGTITNIAYTLMQTYIEDNVKDWDMLGNCHDSYLCQCPIGEERECAKVMKQFIEQELTNYQGEKFRMRSEAQCGFNWGPAKTPPITADKSDPLVINKYNLQGLQTIKV